MSQINRSTIAAALAVILLSFLTPGLALAGTGGDELKEGYDWLISLLEGYGSMIFIAVAGVFALAGSVLQFSFQRIMGLIGVAVLSVYGIPALTGVVSALL